MTPEQQAEYALNRGIARSDLLPEAQRAYDRLAELRAPAPTPAPVAADAKSGGGHVILPRGPAARGTALIFLAGQGGGVVLLPYAFTHWQQGATPWPVAVQALGVALIAVGGIVVITGFVRFATEGVGIPFPAEPNSRQLTVGGPYRYVRNPLYMAIVMAISGQALLFSRPVLLIYAAVLLATFVAFVHWYEEPTLTRRFGDQYEAYRRQVPGWWPRLQRRALASRASTSADTRPQP